MFNVVLVDDEEWICKLIKNMVDWNALGYQIIAEAHDGSEALELIKKHKPHLVVTDILMPEFDGIMLIKKTRELQIKTDFIIISGYGEFEYARSAIQYNVFGYLLKPVDETELTDMLEKLSEKIRSDHIVKKKAEYSNTVLLEKQIMSLLSDTFNEEKDISLEAYNLEYGLALQEGFFQVALFQFDQIQGRMHRSSMALAVDAFATCIKQYFKSICHEAIVFIKESMNAIVCIFNYSRLSQKQILDGLNHLLMEFAHNDMNHYQKLTIGLGVQAEDITRLKDAYFSALNAVKARIRLGKERVIQYSDPEVALKQLLTIEDERKLQYVVDIFDKKGFESIVNSLFEKYPAKQEDNPFTAFKLAYEIADFIISAMRKKEIYSDSKLTESFEMLQKIDNCSTDAELIDCIGKIFENYLKKYEGSKGQAVSNRLINTIKYFIGENYMRDISLSDAAKLVCLNPTYLSELFKKETGENFSDYLTSYRIAIAKGFLKDVKYKVEDVSALVGYKDPRYFSKIFKKNVGVCPIDYKSMYL